MAELADVWKEVLPQILNNVTGRGIWTALNAAVPLTVEDGFLVLGLPPRDSELGGHLRMPSTSQMIERSMSSKLGSQVRIRVIDGISADDWERVKRRDAEKRRLQEAGLEKMRAEISAKSNWEGVYEQLSRRFAAVSNRSLPQNRARFFEEAIELVAEARKNQTTFDDLGERNFARCLERVAQYAEIPSVLVAKEVLHRAGEL
ncbi:MAG TPA: hypothetical protein VG944_19705 [Fimbriimonas sp.]|nr:hypothetical protein [Fimbriimonas sp.]